MMKVMSGLNTVVWLVQSVWLFVLSALCLFTPSWFAVPMWGGDRQADALTTLMTSYEMRLVVPLTFGVALFSSVAAMREDQDVRRRMAGSFALLLGFCDALFVLHDRRGAFGDVVAVLATLGIVLQGVYALWPRAHVIPPRLSGTANTQPPALWMLWAVQGAGFVAVGVCLVVVPWRQWARIEYLSPVPTVPAAEFIQDFRGMLYLGLGLFSFHAMSLESEWHWRLYSGIFSLIAGVAMVVSGLFWSAGTHSPLVLLPILPLLVVFLANGRFWRRHRDPIGEEIGHGPDGWTLLDIPTGPFLAIQSLFYRRRSTHLMGVGARGTFWVAPEGAGFPPHSFFTPGRKFPLQARFATLTSRDDACCDIRGAAIRLSGDLQVESPFDMLMNSGAIAGPSDMAGFCLGVVSRFMPRSFFDGAVEKDLQTREALIAGRRRAPECYSTLHYYSQVVRFWVGTDHVRRLVRYRLTNPERAETGIPDAKDSAAIWVSERREGVRRPSDYLRTALKQRLAGKKPIRLIFQAQFHRPMPGDSLDWYNAAVDWPPDDHPWVAVGEVLLTEPLSDEETERLEFNAANHPPNLGIPAANGMHDFRSLGDAERRVIRRLASYRRTMYEVLGLPRFGNTLPNERGR